MACGIDTLPRPRPISVRSAPIWRRRCPRLNITREVDVQARALETVDLLLDAGANINTNVTNSHVHTDETAIQTKQPYGQTSEAVAAGGASVNLRHRRTTLVLLASEST